MLPIKQDATTQQQAAAAVQSLIPNTQAGLDAAQLIHYALLTPIPNANGSGIYALMVNTFFDGSMSSYLDFFWQDQGMKTAMTSLSTMALTPPDPPVTDETSFENFINENNLAASLQVYQAYILTVKQINGTT